jgi:hypothetical protein
MFVTWYEDADSIARALGVDIGLPDVGNEDPAYWEKWWTGAAEWRASLLGRGDFADMCDRDIVAEALSMAADSVGPVRLKELLRETVFLLVWPRRSLALNIRVEVLAKELSALVSASPSLRVFLDEETISAAWWSACTEAERLFGEGLVLVDPHSPPSEHECPWRTLEDLLAAVEIHLGR